MLDPSGITFGQVSSTVRDLGIFVSLIMAVWKARGAYELAAKFFERCDRHMDVMEGGMKTLLENHLTHIGADVAKLTEKK